MTCASCAGPHTGASAQKFRGKLEVFPDREVAKNVRLLRDIGKPCGDSPGRRQIANLPAGHRDPSGTRAQQARERLDESGFARTVRADHSHYGFRRLVEVHPANDVTTTTVAGSQPLNAKRRNHRAVRHAGNPR